MNFWFGYWHSGGYSGEVISGEYCYGKSLPERNMAGIAGRPGKGRKPLSHGCRNRRRGETRARRGREPYQAPSSLTRSATGLAGFWAALHGLINMGLQLNNEAEALGAKPRKGVAMGMLGTGRERAASHPVKMDGMSESHRTGRPGYRRRTRGSF